MQSAQTFNERAILWLEAPADALVLLVTQALVAFEMTETDIRPDVVLLDILDAILTRPEEFGATEEERRQHVRIAIELLPMAQVFHFLVQLERLDSSICTNWPEGPWSTGGPSAWSG